MEENEELISSATLMLFQTFLNLGKINNDNDELVKNYFNAIINHQLSDTKEYLSGCSVDGCCNKWCLIPPIIRRHFDSLTVRKGHHCTDIGRTCCKNVTETAMSECATDNIRNENTTDSVRIEDISNEDSPPTSPMSKDKTNVRQMETSEGQPEKKRRKSDGTMAMVPFNGEYENILTAQEYDSVLKKFEEKELNH